MKDNLFLRYDMLGAYYCGENRHPMDVMRELGFELIKGRPIPVADQWWFEVKPKIINLPTFIKPISEEILSDDYDLFQEL